MWSAPSQPHVRIRGEGRPELFREQDGPVTESEVEMSPSAPCERSLLLPVSRTGHPPSKILLTRRLLEWGCEPGGSQGAKGVQSVHSKGELKVSDLLALNEKNDPFYCGKPAQRRDGEWFAELWERFKGRGGQLRRMLWVPKTRSTAITRPFAST